MTGRAARVSRTIMVDGGCKTLLQSAIAQPANLALCLLSFGYPSLVPMWTLSARIQSGLACVAPQLPQMSHLSSWTDPCHVHILQRWQPSRALIKLFFFHFSNRFSEELHKVKQSTWILDFSLYSSSWKGYFWNPSNPLQQLQDSCKNGNNNQNLVW